ncbi:MAG: permease [Patescibacteria group bacterium]
MFQYIADLITYDLFEIAQGSPLADSVNFFIYDVLKISVLIFFIVSLIAFVRTYIPTNKIRDFMSGSHYGFGNVAAATFGAVTPFCSCSSVPLFIGFIKARVPLGIAFSFLITSPLVNEVAFVIMGGLFGWKLAVLYALSGILLGVIAGIILGMLKMENSLILEDAKGGKMYEYIPSKFVEKIKYSSKDGWKTFKKLLPYIVVGIGIGAVVYGYVPQEFFINYVGKYSVFAVPVAVVVGVPIYAGCSTVAPLIFGITANGVPLGTSLALMMSIAGLSLPEGIMLRRVMNMKLLATFFGIVAVGILLIGYLFNFLG